MVYTAQYFQDRILSGLQLAGQNEDGELLWMGTGREWRKIEEDGREDKELLTK